VQEVQVSHRIVQLDGTPIMDPSILLQISGRGYKEPPSDPNNIKQIIQEVLDAEARTCYRNICQISKKVQRTDLVTHEMFDLLEDEVVDDEE
jgi:ferritin-like protein